MRIKTIATCLLLCAGFFPLFITSSFGQLTKVWTNSYVVKHDTDYIDYTNIKGNKLQFDGSGNCYFFSQFNTLAANQQSIQAKMQTIKYSSSGSTVWTHRDSGTTFNQCYGCGARPQEMIVNNDGTSYGVAIDGAGSPNYAFLASTKPTGVANWNNSRDANASINIVEDFQGNICLTTNGQTIDGYGLQNIILSKINLVGNTNWTVYHSSPDGLGYTGDQKVVTDKKGNFFAAASTYKYSASGNLFLTKFDSSGAVIWEKKFDSTGRPSVTDFLYNTVDDCLYLTYNKVENDTFKLKIAKISNTDSVNWIKTKTYPSGSTKLKQDNQGNIYWWFGQVYYGEVLGDDYLTGEISKYNSAGLQLSDMFGSSFDVDASGYTYTTHWLTKNNQYYNAIRKYSPNGLLLYDYPAYHITPYSGIGYYSEVYKDESNNIYTLLNYVTGGDTISVNKFTSTCTAKAAPAKPKSITGSAVMYCDNSYYNYSCSAVANALYYNWTVPTGVMIDSGQGTTKLYIHHYTGFKTGQISVYASNCFGASAAVVKAVTDTLKPTAKITGSTSVCKGQTNVQYTAQAVAGAISYQWTIPAGATFTQGYATSGLVVHVDFGSTSGKVSVMAMNYCDTGVAKSLQVKVTNCVAGMSVEAESSKSIVYPNPSSGAFTLKFGSVGKEYHQLVTVVVKDVSGKVMEQLSSVTASSVSFGSRLMKGVYFVEVVSGEEKEVLKVVKE